MAEEKELKLSIILDSEEAKSKLDEFRQYLENIEKSIGSVRAGETPMPREGLMKRMQSTIMEQTESFRGTMPEEQFGKVEKAAQAVFKKLEGMIPEIQMKELNKQYKETIPTIKDLKSQFATGALQIGNMLEGLSRGSLTQFLGGATGLGSVMTSGMGKSVAEGAGQAVGAQVAGTVAGNAISKALGGITSVLTGGAGLLAAASAWTGIGLVVNYASMFGKAKERFAPMSQAYMGMMRAEDALGTSGLGVRGMRDVPFREQWAYKMASQHGVGINEITAPTSSFMMQGGRAGAARGVVEQAIQMQGLTGTAAQTFSDSVAKMERWVPKGDFSKAIAAGFTDSQRYGLGGLARSGEWYSAQATIVEMMGRRGGWQSPATESASRSVMMTMAQYGFGGMPGAQLATQIGGSLPGMMGDPMKAAAAYSIFGLTPMQMLRPGASVGGKTAINQILDVARTPAFRQMMGGEMGAGMFAMGMGWDPELFMRLQKGETLAPQKIKEMLSDKSTEMKKDPVFSEMLAQNDLQLEELALSRDFLFDISVSTKIAAAALIAREAATLHGPAAEAAKKFMKDAFTESPETFGDYGNMRTIHTTVNLDGKQVGKSVKKFADQRTPSFGQ
jgi:hypothetical protein